MKKETIKQAVAPYMQELAGLAQSIRENGLLQPITVRKTDSGYELVAGERRLRACKLAKMETIPSIVCNFTDQRTAALGLLENLQRLSYWLHWWS